MVCGLTLTQPRSFVLMSLFLLLFGTQQGKKMKVDFEGVEGIFWECNINNIQDSVQITNNVFYLYCVSGAAESLNFRRM